MANGQIHRAEWKEQERPGNSTTGQGSGANGWRSKQERARSLRQNRGNKKDRMIIGQGSWAKGWRSEQERPEARSTGQNRASKKYHVIIGHGSRVRGWRSKQERAWRVWKFFLWLCQPRSEFTQGHEERKNEKNQMIHLNIFRRRDLPLLTTFSYMQVYLLLE